MPKPTVLLPGLIFLLVMGPVAQVAADEAAPKALDHASVRFEQNATDGDVEVVFEITGGDEGLAKLTVTAPDGRVVADFAAPDSSTLGIRSFQMESPEPKDVAALEAAYPQGTYRFAAMTSSGRELHGEATLSHRLPATATFVHPREEAEGVGTEGLRIAWSRVDGIATCLVEIEQDELGAKLNARLPGSETAFAVPSGFLRPGEEYQLSIGTVSSEGNITFVETTFTTAQ